MEKQNKKYAYIRTSTVGQSLDRQRDAFKDMIIFEEQKSGKNIQDRPVLTKLINDVMKDGDTLYVLSLDRCCRNLKDLCGVIDLLLNKGCSFVSLHENIELKANVPTTKMVIQIFGAVAEFQRTLILQACNEGRDAAKSRGDVKFGRPKVSNSKIKKALEMYNKYHDEMTVTQIAKANGISKTLLYNEIKKNKHF